MMIDYEVMMMVMMMMMMIPYQQHQWVNHPLPCHELPCLLS